MIFLSSLSLDDSKVKTKAINEPAESSDGLRYFIVRYPMNVGRKHYFQWIPEVAPSAKLLRQWKNRKITWKIFDQKYREEMNTVPEAQNKIHELKELVKQGQTITLLCFEAEFRHDCHRHILKEIILQSESKLEGKLAEHLNMSSAEILSYIPRQKKKNDQVKLEAELDKITIDIPPKCYYCNYRKFKNKSEYQKHVIVKHPGKLCYPSISDEIESQGMKWEI